MKVSKIIFLLFIFSSCGQAQNGKKNPWDDTSVGKWHKEFIEIQIPSSLDTTLQGAIMYKAKSKTSRPLIVSLHSWSGDYKQEDSLAPSMVEHDYNYIHPNFRGPNNTPQACGSKYVISDLEDAIAYAVKNANVDPREVHIVGGSGGGYATLLAYMNIKYPVKSFSAWVPISNLENWYWESVGRKQIYKDHIMQATSSDSVLNVEEALKRSPLSQVYPSTLRKSAQLFIYAGIHDGYQGAVPITQSIDMYNKIAREAFGASADELVSEADKLELVVKRCFPKKDYGMKLGDRKVHYFKKKENVSIFIFEGGHEEIVKQVLPFIPIDKKYVTVFGQQ